MAKAVAFYRVSSHKQEGNHSFEVQQSAVRRWAAANDYELIECEPVVESATCSEADRVEFRKALALMTSCGAETFVVYSMDRFFRNTEEGLRVARIEFLNKGRNLVSVLQGGMELATPFGRFVFTQFLAVAEFESGNSKSRFTAGAAAKRAKGGYTGGEAPYGWQPDMKGGLTEHSQEQEVIRQIRKLNDAGWSAPAIAASLNSTGYRTRYDCAWEPRAVRSVLLRQAM